MSISQNGSRWKFPAGAGLAIALLSASPVIGGGFFDALFGGPRQGSDAAYSQPRSDPLPYADPTPPSSPSAPGLSITVPPAASAPSVSFCVRLCDGRYFPVQRHANMTPVQACSSMCPAAKTKVFFGSEAAHARAGDGTRYDDINNAYVYRTKVVDNCTCNGKTPFGLAPMDAASDPTLKAGDMVATDTGLVKFTGSAMQLRKSIGAAPESQPTASRSRKRVADALAPIH